eukprot:5873947-Prymnesium_polylepis.1
MPRSRGTGPAPPGPPCICCPLPSPSRPCARSVAPPVPVVQRAVHAGETETTCGAAPPCVPAPADTHTPPTPAR